MTPRERIIAALERRATDRLPIDFAGTDCSSVHLVAYDRLRKKLGIEPRAMRLGCLMQQIAEADRELLAHFRSDAEALCFHPRKWRLWESGYGFDVEVAERWRPERLPDGSMVVKDAQGVVRSRRAAGGFYFDPAEPVFASVTSPGELDAHAAVFDRWDWPAVLDESVPEYAARARKLRDSTDRALVAMWRMHYLQAGQILRGYEQFLMDLLTDEPLVRALMDRLHAAYMARARSFLDAVGESIDVVFFTDDLGAQTGPLVGPEVFRRLIKPYWAEMIALVKSRGKKVLMHSCGAISAFLPDMIEMGVDAVNPVQITAAGMAPAELKRQFGKDIAFWGGGVSTQGVLDRGSPAQVRDEVRRNIDVFSRGGGYVFTQVHNIQADVPPENILAAYDAARAV